MTSPDARPTSGGTEAAPAATRSRSVAHPRYNLAQVESFARRAFVMGARHLDQDQIARAQGYTGSVNGAYKGLRAASSYFGLIAYSDDRYLSVTEPWIEGFHADEEAGRQSLRRSAVQKPDLYRQLIEEFAERQLPDADKLARQLHLTAKYGILKDAAHTAANAFLDSVRFAGLVDVNNFLRLNGVTPTASHPAGDSAAPAVPARLDHASPQRTTGPNAGSRIVPEEAHLDRIEVQLAGGRRAYLFVPVPLPAREKERLKKYIDLILEEEETPAISAN